MTVEIRALAKGDNRTGFRSGDQALDLYFHRYAGQNQFRHHIGVTYVALHDDVIIGFATVSPASLDADEVRSRRKMPPFPVPVSRVARLAVHEAARGQGVGKAILRFCIELAERMRDELGCVGVVVDAKAPAEGFYTQFGFVTVEATEGRSIAKPQPTLMYLPLGAIPKRT